MTTAPWPPDVPPHALPPPGDPLACGSVASCCLDAHGPAEAAACRPRRLRALPKSARCSRVAEPCHGPPSVDAALAATVRTRAVPWWRDHPRMATDEREQRERVHVGGVAAMVRALRATLARSLLVPANVQYATDEPDPHENS